MAAAPPAKRQKENHAAPPPANDSVTKENAWFHPRTDDRASASINDLHGFDWRLESYLHYMDHKQYLAVKVTNLKNDESPLWHCQAEVNIRLVHNNHSRTIEKITFTRFSPSLPSYTTILGLKDDFWADEGFCWLQTNSIIVNVKINVKVLSAKGDSFFKNPHTNWAEEVTGSDMCLIVEGEPFFVGKYNLARHSHYFEVLFGRDYSENGKRQIELKEISKDEFRLFLDFIHNMGVEVDIGTVWSLLEMGRYFNAPTVMSAAEEYLTSTDNELALAESFVLADQFHLTAVMDWCMQKLTTVSQCNQVRGSERWDVLSEETKRSIDEAYSRLAPPTQTVHNYPSPFQYLQQQYIPPSFAQQWAAPNHNYTGGSGNASSLSGMMWSQMYMNHYRIPVPQLAPPPVPAPVPVAQVAQLAVPSQLVTAPGALQPQVAVPRPVKRSRKQKVPNKQP